MNSQAVEIPVMNKNQSPFKKQNGENKNKPTFQPPAPLKLEFYQLIVPILVGDSIKWVMAEQYFDSKARMVEFEPGNEELKGYISFQPAGLPIQFITTSHRLYSKRHADVNETYDLLNGGNSASNGNRRTKIVTQTVQVPVHYLTTFQRVMFGSMFLAILVMAFHIAQMGG